jgi:hypothetical protein
MLQSEAHRILWSRNRGSACEAENRGEAGRWEIVRSSAEPAKERRLY